MCPSKQKIANIAPIATEGPDKAPAPIVIEKDTTRKRIGGRKDLRIDLATSPPSSSGINV